MQLNQEKFADLKFLDSHVLEIWVFLIANWEIWGFKKICMPTFANLPPLSTILAAKLPLVHLEL